MSIKNCQAIQKSCLERESNAWFTLGSESESVGFEITKGAYPIVDYDMFIMSTVKC